jgi:hypothetical protein
MGVRGTGYGVRGMGYGVWGMGGVLLKMLEYPLRDGVNPPIRLIGSAPVTLCLARCDRLSPMGIDVKEPQNWIPREPWWI